MKLMENKWPHMFVSVRVYKFPIHSVLGHTNYKITIFFVFV